MKILFVTPFFPCSSIGHAGGNFIYEVIKELSRRRHQIHLLARIDPELLSCVDEMKAFCTHVELLPFKTPRTRNIMALSCIIGSYLYLGMKANRLLQRERFDLVQVEYLETGLMVRRTKIPMIVDAHDVITKPVGRSYLAATGFIKKTLRYCIWKLTGAAEKYITTKFDLVFTRSKQDMDILLNQYKEVSVRVVPHPVIDSFQPAAYDREPNTMIFVGDMRRNVNTEAALYLFEKIWPLVRREIPGIKLYIVGSQPDRRIRALPGIDKNVVVTGFVEKLEPYYLRASVFVSPLFTGGGIIAKNLEAMSLGLPVVTTSIGNEGVGALPGREVLIADTAKSFAQQIVMLLRDAQKSKEIGDNGRKFVTENFDLASIVNTIEQSWEALVLQS
jgi:glycosyltransferase involved in cell wall biosynthesis